jgi:hypothetical protein
MGGGSPVPPMPGTPAPGTPGGIGVPGGPGANIPPAMLPPGAPGPAGPAPGGVNEQAPVLPGMTVPNPVTSQLGGIVSGAMGTASLNRDQRGLG